MALTGIFCVKGQKLNDREVVWFQKSETFIWENTSERGGKWKAGFVYERRDGSREAESDPLLTERKTRVYRLQTTVSLRLALSWSPDGWNQKTNMHKEGSYTCMCTRTHTMPWMFSVEGFLLFLSDGGWVAITQQTEHICELTVSGQDRQTITSNLRAKPRSL